MTKVLGIKEFEVINNDVQKFVYEELIHANRMGELEEYLKKLKFPIDKYSFFDLKDSKKTILVIGQSHSRIDVLLAKAQEFGFSEDDFEFVINYEDINKYSFKKLKNNSNYLCILVGQMGHKQKDIGNWSSKITQLESEEGYPITIRVVDKSNNLKLNANSFGAALETLLMSYY